MWQIPGWLRFSRALVRLSILLLPLASIFGAGAVREFPFSIRALVYDSFTARIYATSPDGLLQIDPESGQLQRTFLLGTNLSRLELGGANGLWMGLDGDGAVRRFNLETLTAENPIVVRPNSSIADISSSEFDPYTLAVGTYAASSQAFLIRNGVVLPNTVAVAILALGPNEVFGYFGNTVRFPIDAFGINGPYSSAPGGVPLKFSNNTVYNGSGIYWLAPYGVYRNLPIYPAPGTLTINRDNGEIHFLSLVQDHMVLSRYNSSRVNTGSYTIPEFPPFYPTSLTLAAWSSNRLAFHTSSNLYLVDLDQAFAQADLEILRQEIVPANPVFTQPVTVTLTVTNRGPGSALRVLITNLFPIGTLGVTNGQPAGAYFDVLGPGQSAQLSTTVIPAAPGTLISHAGVSSDNDPEPLNNSRDFSFPVSIENPRLIHLAFSALDMAYDSISGRLFYYNGVDLAGIEPAEPRLLQPLRLPGPARAALSAAGGALAIGYFNTAPIRIDALTWQRTDLAATSAGSIQDIKISPVNRNLIVTSDSSGSFVNRGDAASLLDFQSGYLGFSEDGSVLYLADSQCALDSYAVGPAGLVFQKRVPNIACGDFSVADGLLYFNSGLIYNPDTGERRFAGPVPPSFVSLGTPGLLDVLHRTNNVWAVTRFDRATLGPRLTIPLPDLPTGVLDALSAGENRIAARTLSEIYLVELPGVFSGVRAIRRDPGEIALRFSTSNRNRYQVEQSLNLATDSWSALGASLTGDGYSAEVILSATQPSFAFYRIVELPPGP